jgi:methyl-accepting chemotaxis protein
MTDDTKRPERGLLRTRGLYWRSVGLLLVFQAVGWGGAAALAYLILSPALAKDYFSAHNTVKATWQLVVPALAVSAGAGFLVVGIGSALSLRSHSRRLLEPLRQIDGVIQELASGRIPRPGEAKRPGAAEEAAATLEPLRARVQELQRIARDMQKISLELNYRSAGSAEVTLKDLRALASQLDASTKDLVRASGWFEG